MIVTCPNCGHQDDYAGDARHEVLTCTECRARIAFGVLMPRVTVQPHPDRRFVVVRVETLGNGQRSISDHVLDRDYGFEVAREIASITAPMVIPAAAIPKEKLHAHMKRLG